MKKRERMIVKTKSPMKVGSIVDFGGAIFEVQFKFGKHYLINIIQWKSDVANKEYKF